MIWWIKSQSGGRRKDKFNKLTPREEVLIFTDRDRKGFIGGDHFSTEDQFEGFSLFQKLLTVIEEEAVYCSELIFIFKSLNSPFFLSNGKTQYFQFLVIIQPKLYNLSPTDKLSNNTVYINIFQAVNLTRARTMNK